MAVKVDERIRFIKRFPRAGALVTGYSIDLEIRRFELRRFPYYLFVALLADECILAAVAHKRQAPGYWVDRLPKPRR